MPVAKKDVIVIPPHRIGRGIKYVIDNAEIKCILISPYIDILGWKEIQNAIANAINRKVKIELYVCKRHNCSNKSAKMLTDMGADIFEVRNLHAKVYMNEKHAIISSLNLLYYSFKNSKEAGLFINNENIIADLIKFNYIPLERIRYCISYTINFCIDLPTLEDYFPALFRIRH